MNKLIKMKTHILTAVIALIVFASCTQKANDSDIPKGIIETFNSNFKGSTVESWEKENDGGYEAEFDLNGVETSATFSAEGRLIETEQEIEESALPSPISDYLKINYAGKSIDEVAKITTDEGIVKYEVEIEKVDFIFDEKGNLSK
jgi:hypothetical protein